MNEFLNKTSTWISTKPNLFNTKQILSLRIHLLNHSLLLSYLVIEDANGGICAIPINSEILISINNDSLLCTFTNYDDIQIGFDFADLNELELIVSHMSRSSILFNQKKDMFYENNLNYLNTLKLPKKIATKNDERFLAGSTAMTPITTIASAKSMWHDRTVEINSPFYTKFNDIRFSCLTWNVAGHRPQEDVLADIVRCFKVPTAPSDVIIIAFQEIDMSVKSVVTGASGLSDKWTSIVTIAQEHFGASKLELVASESMGSVYCAALVRKGMYPMPVVGPINSIKLGVGGLFANKAAILVPFKIGEAKIMAVCCHLAPHESHCEERNEQWREVYKAISPEYDHIIMMGDLNYRVSLPYDEVIEKINKEEFKDLLEADQLRNEKKKCPIIGSFNEPDIRFKPTYKFDKNCDIYDTSPKKRVPSWTDRVLVRTSEPRSLIGPLDSLVFETDVSHQFMISNPLFTTDCHSPTQSHPELNYPKPPQPICYRSLRCTFSDHRPVHSALKFSVPVIDQDRYNQLQEIIEAKYQELRINCVPKLHLTPSSFNYQGEQSVEVLLENKSLIWINWNIKGTPQGCTIEPSSGRLYVSEKKAVTIEFQSNYMPSDPIVFEIKGGRAIPFKIKSESFNPILKVGL